MGILALLTGLAVIAGLFIYWIVIATLFVIGIVFVLWLLTFVMFFNLDPYAAGLGAIVATGLTLWLYSLHSDKK